MEETIVMKEEGSKISRRIEEGLRRWEEEGVRKCEEEIHRRRGNGTVPRREDETGQQLRENGKRRETPRKSSDSNKVSQRSEEERLLRQIEDVSRKRKDGTVQREEVIIVEGGHRRKMSSGQEVPVPAPRKRDDRSHSESHSHSHSHSKKAKSHSHSKSQSQSSSTPRRDGISSSAASPRKDGKRSISPKKEAAHQSVSPRKEAKRSKSPCREGKRSISPRREAKRSISPKKEARQSSSATTANRKDERAATSSQGLVMCHHNDRPVSPQGSVACYREERVMSPRVSTIRPHSPGEEALGPMSPRHVQEPAFSCTNEFFSSATARREPQPRTASLGTSMGSSIETSTTGAHFTDTQPRTTSMGTSMGSSMETSTGEQETGSTPQFVRGTPAMALRGETVKPRDSTTHGLQSDEMTQPEHLAQVYHHTHSSQDVVSSQSQPISPALRSRDLASHSQQDRRDLRPELVRPISPALRSPALSCPVPRPPTTLTSSSLTSAGSNEGDFIWKLCKTKM